MSTASAAEGHLYSLGQRMPDREDFRTVLLLRHSGIHPLDVPGEGKLVTAAEVEAEIGRRGLTVAIPEPLPAPTADEARATVQRLQAAGAHLMTLLAGLKRPPTDEWPTAGALTEDEAVEHLVRGGNLGINLGPSRIIVIDAEDGLATAAMVEAGLIPTAITARAQDPANTKKCGGSHFWLAIPDDLPQPLRGTVGATVLPNGGVIEWLAGGADGQRGRFAVVAPSRLGDAPGFRYSIAEGGALDGDGELQVAPRWLYDATVEAPTSDSDAFRQALLRKLQPRVKRPRTEAGDAVTAAVDEIDWSEWIDGDPRVQIIGSDASCGCGVFHWHESTESRSGILHDGCEIGFGVHVFSNTLQAAWGRDHGSRLQFAAWLRYPDLEERAREQRLAAVFEIELHPRLAAVLPEHFAADAARAEAAGDSARAERFRQAGIRLVAVDGEVVDRPSNLLGGVGGVGGGGDSEPTLRVLPGAVPPAPGYAPSAPPAPPVDLTDLEEDEPVDFPVDCLPAVLQDHCRWVMAAVNLPAAMLAPMYLPVLAGAGGRATITPRVGWVEHGPIWALIIAPPSTRKSPALKQIRDPLMAVIDEVRTAMKREVSESDAAITACEKALETAEDELQKAHAAERAARDGADLVNGRPAALAALAAAQGEVAQLEAELAELQAKAPKVPDLVFDDATPEAMQDRLRSTGGRGLLISPEAGTWFDLATRTDARKMSTSDNLKAYDAEAITVDRVGRGSFKIEDPDLSKLMLIQPEVLAAAMAPSRDGTQSNLHSNGAWARFAAAHVPSVDPDRFRNGAVPDPGTALMYRAALARLFRHSLAVGQGVTAFKLSETAASVFEPIYDAIELVKAAADDTAGGRCAEWGKAAGRVLRIARVFAQLRATETELWNAIDTGDGKVAVSIEISADEIKSAWEIVRWFMASSARATGAMEAEAGEDRVAQARAWLLKRLESGPVSWRKLRGVKKHRPFLRDALEAAGTAGEIVGDGDGYRLVEGVAHAAG